MARLGDICEKVTDYVASGSFAALKENVLITNEENYAIMVKTADFSNGFTKALTYTDKRGYDFLKNSNLFGGELILSNIGSIGKVFKVPYLDRPMTLASNTVMIKTATPELTDYLYYYFLSPAGYKSLLSISSGTSMLKFNKTELKKLEIPIPDIDKQRRIIAVMDKVSNLISLRKQQLQKLDELVKARFVEMFGDYIKDDRRPLSEVAIITGGLTKNSNRNTFETKMPYLRVANVFYNRLDLREILEIGVKEEEIEKTLLQAGDLLFVEGNGSIEQIGRVAIWDGSIDPILHQNHLIKARFNNEIIAPEYALFYFMLQDGRQQIISKSVSTSGLNTLSVNKVSSLLLPIPPIALQKQFGEFFKQTDKSKVAVQKALDEAQLLFDSLMQKYFE